MGQRATYDDVDYVVKDWSKGDPAIEATLRQETSRRFHGMMDNSMMVSFYKYGPVAAGFPERVNALESLQLRLKMYTEGKKNPDFGDEGEPEYLIAPGNAEYLVDAANFAMIEFMHPKHPDARLEHTDSQGSPGRVSSNAEIYDRPTQLKNTDLEPTA